MSNRHQTSDIRHQTPTHQTSTHQHIRHQTSDIDVQDADGIEAARYDLVLVGVGHRVDRRLHIHARPLPLSLSAPPLHPSTPSLFTTFSLPPT
eukprot:3477085-Rhodomonas_salina.1